MNQARMDQIAAALLLYRFKKEGINIGDSLKRELGTALKEFNVLFPELVVTKAELNEVIKSTISWVVERTI